VSVDCLYSLYDAGDQAGPEALRLSMTLRLGSMLAVVAGVTISVILGVLRLWL
jgi:hypothetical protein